MCVFFNIIFWHGQSGKEKFTIYGINGLTWERMRDNIQMEYISIKLKGGGLKEAEKERERRS